MDHLFGRSLAAIGIIASVTVIAAVIVSAVANVVVIVANVIGGIH